MQDSWGKKVGKTLLGAALGTLFTFVAEKAYKHMTRYDKDGFDKDGYNKHGVDRDGYHRDGYNDEDFDRDGFDRDGYNHKGFDRSGRDKRGYDQNGRNEAGYDRRGYDIEGYDNHGFAEDGFNREDLDCDGFNRHGYNVAGIDRNRKCKEVYEKLFVLLHGYLQKAFTLHKKGEYAYALYEARRVLEETLEQFITHYLGESMLGKTPEENINICYHKRLLSEDVAQSLHSARRQCNKDPHEIDARDSLDPQTVWTVLLQVESFLEIAENDLIYG